MADEQQKEETTYIDTLQGSGFIPGYPGMHSHGTRIVRDKETHEIVEVLPPLSVEQAAAQAQEQPVPVAEEMTIQPAVEAPVQDAPQETQAAPEAAQEQPVPPVEG